MIVNHLNVFPVLLFLFFKTIPQIRSFDTSLSKVPFNLFFLYIKMQIPLSLDLLVLIWKGVLVQSGNILVFTLKQHTYSIKSSKSINLRACESMNKLNLWRGCESPIYSSVVLNQNHMQSREMQSLSVQSCDKLSCDGEQQPGAADQMASINRSEPGVTTSTDDSAVCWSGNDSNDKKVLLSFYAPDFGNWLQSQKGHKTVTVLFMSTNVHMFYVCGLHQSTKQTGGHAN